MKTELAERYLIDQEGKKIAVVLDLETYQQLLDELDELRCEKGYEQAVKETTIEIEQGDYLTLDEYIVSRKCAR
jgi:PHD/YefM family antitoxin component YafN of YafNO toxin-antitoxin module